VFAAQSPPPKPINLDFGIFEAAVTEIVKNRREYNKNCVH